MTKKALFLDALPFNSVIQVGSHKYAQLFHADGYEVFSLSHFLNPYTFIRKNSEDKELIQSWKAGVQKNSKGIFFYSPFCFLPYLNLPLLDNVNFARRAAKFCIPNLAKLLDQYGFLDVDLVFVNNIRLISVLNIVNTRVKIYRISDRIESFNNQPKSILTLHSEVIQSVDCVFATSTNLQEEVAAINQKSFYLPNGVDHTFVRQPDDNLPMPADLKGVKRPVALYVGAISDWFDYELYEYGLKKLKDVSFVMIGTIGGTNYSANLSTIQTFCNRYKNFYFLGPKQHVELKKYLSFSDVGIIPFTINPLTNEINPVKLYEYASWGLPVVSSEMAELNKHKQIIFFYKNKNNYIDMIMVAIEKKEELYHKQIQFALDNTWEHRFAYMKSRI